ncbi:MAG: hypothetical protein HY651_04170 [Acidobacteria bacterium]|nr:hypothetical protein [Acidobacteriota bacterium]
MTIRHWTLILLLTTVACGPDQGTQPPVELKHFALDSMDGIRAAAGASLDPAVSSDGHGSLRIDAAEPATVPLFEVTDVSIENAALIYQASVQTESLQGQTYLEMWVRLPGKGEYFSRGLDRPLSGTTSWATVATPFFLEAGQKPDLIRLNLVVNGKGKVWIDDIRLLRQAVP